MVHCQPDEKPKKWLNTDKLVINFQKSITNTAITTKARQEFKIIPDEDRLTAAEGDIKEKNHSYGKNKQVIKRLMPKLEYSSREIAIKIVGNGVNCCCYSAHAA